MAGNGALGKGGVDGDRGSRGERVYERLPGRAIPEKLQGRGDLRRHARHPHADAGGLGAGAEKRKSGPCHSAALSAGRGEGNGELVDPRQSEPGAVATGLLNGIERGQWLPLLVLTKEPLPQVVLTLTGIPFPG